MTSAKARRRAMSIGMIAVALAFAGCLGAHHRGEGWKQRHHGETCRHHRGACQYAGEAYSKGALKCVERHLLECGEAGEWTVKGDGACR